MSIEGHCPRCGATLPQDDDILCPGCGLAIGDRTVAIEVSPDELLAGVARGVPGTPFEAEVSAVVTSTSGLLKTEPGHAALAAPDVAAQSRLSILVMTIAVTIVLLLLALVVVLVSGR